LYAPMTPGSVGWSKSTPCRLTVGPSGPALASLPHLHPIAKEPPMLLPKYTRKTDAHEARDNPHVQAFKARIAQETLQPIDPQILGEVTRNMDPQVLEALREASRQEQEEQLARDIAFDAALWPRREEE
jgi:hypothetical protein